MDPTGLRPSPQQTALDQLLAGAALRLTNALSTVRETYRHSFHRIAARSRHGISLLDPEQGLAWVGRKESDRKVDMEALEGGALVVADIEGRSLIEFLVPVTLEAYEAIRICWNHADWLLSMLCGSIIARAETPAGTVVPIDDALALEPSAEREAAVIAYTGYDPTLWLREGLTSRTTDAVYAAAERMAGPNRAQRRHGVGHESRRPKRR